MNFENLSIVSVSHVDAPHIITSAEIQAELSETMGRLGLPDTLLEGIAGIHERRFWDEGVEPSDAATLAAEAALHEHPAEVLVDDLPRLDGDDVPRGD